MLTSSDIERASHCTFQPQSGRYFDRCRATATLIEVSKGPNHTWRQKRCDKHFRLDERTATNRRRQYGWASTYEYEPFDAQAALTALMAERRAQAEQAALVQNHENLVAALRVAVDSKALSEVDQPIVERLLKAYSGE
jgi:hypothetical protein